MCNNTVTLTIAGWQPDFDLGAFFVMLKNTMEEGRAQIDFLHYQYEYSEREAHSAFVRVAGFHGWEP